MRANFIGDYHPVLAQSGFFKHTRFQKRYNLPTDFRGICHENMSAIDHPKIFHAFQAGAGHRHFAIILS